MPRGGRCGGRKYGAKLNTIRIGHLQDRDTHVRTPLEERVRPAVKQDLMRKSILEAIESEEQTSVSRVLVAKGCWVVPPEQRPAGWEKRGIPECQDETSFK
jgi:hypothetical protein